VSAPSECLAVRPTAAISRSAADRPRASSRGAAIRTISNRRPIQLATKLTWNSQAASVSKGGHTENATVGHVASAVLDPTDEIAGHETSSTEYKPFYDFLQAIYKETFIRGHLINADFGGSNIAANLFPITSKANSLHKSNVENHVKGWMKDAATRRIDYSVTAHQGANVVQDAVFDCTAKRVNTAGKVDKTVARTITSSPQKATKGVRNYDPSDTEAWSYPGITNIWKWIKGTQWLHNGPLGVHDRGAIDAIGSHLRRDSAHGPNHGYY
jgi:hypothetical protein